MNLQQVNIILENAKSIESTNFDEIIQSLYPDNKDLENIQLPNMTLSEFIYLSKRVMNQFIAHFQNRDLTLVLPNIYVHPQYGSAQVDVQIKNFFTHISPSSSNLNAAEQNLLWLSAYQLEYNLYDRSIEITKDITLKNLTQLSEKVNLFQKNIENNKKDVLSLLDQLQKSKSDIEAFVTQKKEELNQITQNLNTTNTQTNQISQLLNQSTEFSTKSKNLLEQQEQNKTTVDKRLSELESLYDQTNKSLTDNVKTVLEQIESFSKQIEEHTEHLTFVESKKDFFEERINYLEELIGREVGASLFETFKQRKTELNSSLNFWKWAVPIMSVLTVLWIFFLFKNQTTITDINIWWQAFAINTLKSLPAILLLIFTINQYRKERNFQEEYAFKSAVALTIDAYANRLIDPVNKDKLISDAVLSVYKTPIEEKYPNQIKSKKTLDILKNATDTINRLTKTGG